jgi:predicted MFS family arabinose efflux permease
MFWSMKWPARPAAGAIGALMLVTGLSGSIFWPVSALVSGSVGWRGLCLVLAVLIVLVSVPLYGLALPRRTLPPTPSAAEPAKPATRPVPGSIFVLITGAIVLNAIVTFGLNALFIELLKAEGLPPGQAITFASMLGLLQVGARLLDFVGARRWDAISTGIFATAGVMLAFALLLLGNGTPMLIGAFVVIYGLSAGSLAVTRAIMPLSFYDGADFARASMRIALPLNVLTALAAPLFASLLTGPGPTALLATTMGFCGLALVLLLLLARQRSHALVPAAG